MDISFTDKELALIRQILEGTDYNIKGGKALVAYGQLLESVLVKVSEGDNHAGSTATD